MAYVSGNLTLLASAIGGKERIWEYITTDTPATVLAAGYISDATKKRLQIGDRVQVTYGTLNTSLTANPSTAADGTVSEFASLPNVVMMVVSSITTGAATLIAPAQPLINAGTSTSAAGAVTLNAKAGIITTESVTTISQAVYTLTITNSQITIGDLVLGTIQNGTNTTGIPVLSSVTPGAGTLTVKIANASTTTSPFGGTLKFSFVDFN